METGDQLAFGFGQIEWSAFARSCGAGEIRPKGDEGKRIVEDVPLPKPILLSTDEVQVHAARDDDRYNDANGHRHFVADHLSRFAHAAEQGPLAAGTVTGEYDAEYLRGHDGQHEEHADAQRFGDPTVGERQRDEGHEGTTERDIGSKTEEHLVGVAGNEVFLGEQLDAVGDGLQPAELA